LRLGDPSDSAIDRRAAAGVPQGVPGRGLAGDQLHYLTALPRLDGQRSTVDLAGGVADLVRRVAAAWTAPPAPPVRLLPRLLPARHLPAPTPGVPTDRRIPIGIAESDLGPVRLDFDTD